MPFGTIALKIIIVALLVVPIVTRLGLGSIIGYLVTGIIVGPVALGLVETPEALLHFSELGIVLLLFLIGLELSPTLLWQKRWDIFLLGGLQWLVTGSILAFLLYKLGVDGIGSVVLGYGFALSSTAFVLQILQEKRQMQTAYGGAAFAVLMFQDIIVAPMLAALPFLSLHRQTTDSPYSATYWSLLTLGGLLFLVGGRFVVQRVLSHVAAVRNQELMMGLSFLIVLSSAMLAQFVGLSAGLGALIAGIFLASSEYRHEFEVNLAPFKGLLLGLFFMAVGMNLDLKVVMADPLFIVGGTLVLMILKAIILFAVALSLKFSNDIGSRIGVLLAQGGEFAFVVFAQASQFGILPSSHMSVAIAIVTLSMILTPIGLMIYDKYLKKFSDVSERPYDTVANIQPQVIVAGYGRFGQIISRFLRAQGLRHTILEHSSAQVDIARRFGNVVYYGDASRTDLLLQAGLETAGTLVLAIDDVEKSVRIAKFVRAQFPKVHIIARARNRQHAMDLMAVGVENIHREILLTSLEVAKEILLREGFLREQINQRLALFRKHDEAILAEQFKLKDNEAKLLSYTAQANKDLEKILAADLQK